MVAKHVPLKTPEGRDDGVKLVGHIHTGAPLIDQLQQATHLPLDAAQITKLVSVVDPDAVTFLWLTRDALAPPCSVARLGRMRWCLLVRSQTNSPFRTGTIPPPGISLPMMKGRHLRQVTFV